MKREEALRNSAAVHGVRVPSGKGEFSLCCPFCLDRVGKEDDAFKLQANPNAFSKKTGEYGPLFYCYRCEMAGSCDLSWLGDVPKLPVDPDEIPEWSHPPEGFEVLTEQSIALEPYVEYLQKRGVWEQAKHVGVGACSTGYYAGRVVVPMLDDAGKWTGFSARLVKSRASGWDPAFTYRVQPKYLYPKGMGRASQLWGASWVPRLKDRQHPLFLVEGVFDALPLYPYGLAAFGKGVTDQQLDLLVKLVGIDEWQAVEGTLGGPRHVVVCLDGDAWWEGKLLARRLQARGVPADCCRLPPGADPGTLGWKVKDYIVKENG